MNVRGDEEPCLYTCKVKMRKVQGTRVAHVVRGNHAGGFILVCSASSFVFWYHLEVDIHVLTRRHDKSLLIPITRSRPTPSGEPYSFWLGLIHILDLPISLASAGGQARFNRSIPNGGKKTPGETITTASPNSSSTSALQGHLRTTSESQHLVSKS